MSIEEIKITGGQPDAGPDDHATADGLDWTRKPDESVADFRRRVLAEANAASVQLLIFGGLPL
jgi:hypothetical protein